jgi:hypothetical protein
MSADDASSCDDEGDTRFPDAKRGRLDVALHASRGTVVCAVCSTALSSARTYAHHLESCYLKACVPRASCVRMRVMYCAVAQNCGFRGKLRAIEGTRVCGFPFEWPVDGVPPGDDDDAAAAAAAAACNLRALPRLRNTIVVPGSGGLCDPSASGGLDGGEVCRWPRASCPWHRRWEAYTMDRVLHDANTYGGALLASVVPASSVPPPPPTTLSQPPPPDCDEVMREG